MLDEIDQLMKDKAVIYQLYEWAAMEGSKFIVLGIANALDMTKKLPRLLQKDSMCVWLFLMFS